jgi:hypothetical protein
MARGGGECQPDADPTGPVAVAERDLMDVDRAGWLVQADLVGRVALVVR